MKNIKEQLNQHNRKKNKVEVLRLLQSSRIAKNKRVGYVSKGSSDDASLLLRLFYFKTTIRFI